MAPRIRGFRVPIAGKFYSVHPHSNMRFKPAAHTHPPSHTHTHSPCSKTWLFYLIFLREISVSLASSNFSLFITQKKARKKPKHYTAQMCLSRRMPSPSRFPLLLPPSFHFLPLSYLPFFPSSPFCKQVPSYHECCPMKHWGSLRK